MWAAARPAALFGSPSAAPGRTRAAAWLILILLPGLLLYPAIGYHLLEPDEGRYAQIPAEMYAAGEWVTPTMQGEPYLDKPPLLYWLVMLSYTLFGPQAWSARLIPALAVHGCLLATYAFGTHAFGERRGFRAALILAVLPAMAGVGRLLTLDGLLTLWVTLGLFAGYRVATPGRPRWAVPVWAAACGLGALTKGPVAIILAVGPLVAWRFLHPGRAAQIRWTTWLAFAAGVTAINLPWYVAICGDQPQFALYFFWQHNIQRFVDPFDHVEPFWYYAPILAAFLFPATLFVPAAVRAVRAESARRTPELSFCLIAGLGCIAFFSASGCKLPTYILPAFPALALAMAVLTDAGVGPLFDRRERAVAALWLPTLALALWVVLPEYARQRSPMRDEAVVRQYCSDPAVPVASFPRVCNSVAFYLGRSDLTPYRSKEVLDLVEQCRKNGRTVVLFSHRNSLRSFSQALTSDLVLEPIADFRKPGIFGDAPWGLCDMAVVRARTPR
jgi:4-amino-4-deoxy-L-arabinose transferase-like glycosyltransferase